MELWVEPLVCQRGTRTQRTSAEPVGRPSLSSIPSREREYMFISLIQDLMITKHFSFVRQKLSRPHLNPHSFSVSISFGHVSVAPFAVRFSPARLKRSQQILTAGAISVAQKATNFLLFLFVIYLKATRATSQGFVCQVFLYPSYQKRWRKLSKLTF